MKKVKAKSKIEHKSKSAKKDKNIIKTMAEKNIEPVLGGWVAEVFGLNPTKEDYEEALRFVEEITKNAKKEPNYLKLLGSLALFIEKSKFIDKLLPYIFRTITPSSARSQIYKTNSLEFEHKLILEELKNTAEELRQLRDKVK